MIVKDTKLEGVKLITVDIFEDFRGHYIETYNKKLYHEHGIDIDFVQDDFSTSSKHVLRGIHGDSRTWKLVTCIYGRFYLVVVNCNVGDDDFGSWESFLLTGQNGKQVLIPPGYGNAHIVLSDQAVYHYKQSTYYDRSGQFTFKWNDEMFNIVWPIDNPILSKRDR